MNSKMETISKKVCNFACHSSFCNPVFASKTAVFRITFLAGNNYPDLHDLQRGMKFATQISPLLNLLFNFLNLKYEITQILWKNKCFFNKIKII